MRPSISFVAVKLHESDLKAELPGGGFSSALAGAGRAKVSASKTSPMTLPAIGNIDRCPRYVRMPSTDIAPTRPSCPLFCQYSFRDGRLKGELLVAGIDTTGIGLVGALEFLKLVVQSLHRHLSDNGIRGVLVAEVDDLSLGLVAEHGS